MRDLASTWRRFRLRLASRGVPREHFERVRPDRDVFLCSYPKSGRTWVRYFAAAYLNAAFDLGVDLDTRTLFRISPNDDMTFDERGLPTFAFLDRPDVPRVRASHAGFSTRFAGARVVLVVRGLADTLVSYYHHWTDHHRAYGSTPFEGTLSEFVRDERRGAPALVAYLNGWGRGLAESAAPSLFMHYETLRAEPTAGFRELVRFLGLPEDAARLQAAVGASSFERMQKQEREVGLPGRRRGGAPTRVREGRVGGSRDALSADDLAYISAYKGAHLEPNPRFGAL